MALTRGGYLLGLESLMHPPRFPTYADLGSPVLLVENAAMEAANNNLAYEWDALSRSCAGSACDEAIDAFARAMAQHLPAPSADATAAHRALTELSATCRLRISGVDGLRGEDLTPYVDAALWRVLVTHTIAISRQPYAIQAA